MTLLSVARGDRGGQTMILETRKCRAKMNKRAVTHPLLTGGGQTTVLV